MDNRVDAIMKVSILMTYWDRQPAADRALAQFAKTYTDLDAEIVIIDDGNSVPFRMPDVGLTARILTLPQKPGPTPQSATWNRAVEFASGDIIVMNCIEVLHMNPVLHPMLSELGRMGRDGYVLAAAWCPEERKWHCRSDVRVPDCPPGVGIGFCGALHRDLYERAGGFDEDYMDGAGYEDRDFIRRLLRAGAKFSVLDGHAVTHPKAGARIKWPADGFLRNEKMFYSKWPAC